MHYNYDQEGHILRQCILPRRPWCSECRVNAHATKDCPKMIKRWEERTKQWGANLVNVEPRIVEPQPMQSVAIVRKKTREDARETYPIKLIKPASPKKIFSPNWQKQYFKEALETFSQIGRHQSMELLQPSSEGGKIVPTSTPIEEWFWFFLKIVNNGQMLEQLKKNIEMVMQGGAGPKDSGNSTKKYIRRVKEIREGF